MSIRKFYTKSHILENETIAWCHVRIHEYITQMFRVLLDRQAATCTIKGLSLGNRNGREHSVCHHLRWSSALVYIVHTHVCRLYLVTDTECAE